MQHPPQDLTEEFPARAAPISSLQPSSARAARLLEAYQDVCKAMLHAETRLEPVSGVHEADLRRRHMLLRHEIRWLLQAHHA